MKHRELLENIRHDFKTFKKILPDVGRAYDELPQEVFKDGALKGKTKRLMALVGALVSGCSGCILFQTEKAIELGATTEEVLESCSVAVSLGGTMAAAETARVISYLKETGKLESY
jgi:AhpD family alkylhydroperoxidase